MNIKQIQSLINGATWHFAKTMQEIPHSYMRKRELDDPAAFEEFVMYIRKFGDTRQFGGTKVFTYLHLNGYQYWSMGAPLEKTILVNRAECPLQPYDNLPNHSHLFHSSDYVNQDNNLVNVMNQVAWGPLLDVGCGYGWLIDNLNVPVVNYTGIDPSIEQLNQAVAGHPDYQDRFFLTTLKNARFKIGSFKSIIATYGSASYCTLEDWAHARALLHPDGKVFAMFYKPGYVPKTHQAIKTDVPFNTYRIPELIEVFEYVLEFDDYYVGTNAAEIIGWLNPAT